MSKKNDDKKSPLSPEGAEIKKPVAAVVHEDFVWQVSLYPGHSGHTQLFRRKVVITGTKLIEEMLAANKPIEVIE